MVLRKYPSFRYNPRILLGYRLSLWPQSERSCDKDIGSSLYSLFLSLWTSRSVLSFWQHSLTKIRFSFKVISRELLFSSPSWLFSRSYALLKAFWTFCADSSQRLNQTSRHDWRETLSVSCALPNWISSFFGWLTALFESFSHADCDYLGCFLNSSFGFDVPRKDYNSGPQLYFARRPICLAWIPKWGGYVLGNFTWIPVDLLT